MSSGKRGGNEESILAMLERDAGRGGRTRTARLALYGASGVLAVGLIGVLVWLARDQGSTDVIMAQAPVLTTDTAPAEAAAAPQSAQASEQPPSAQAATIVDEPEPAHQQEVPPLVLLAPLPSPPPSAAEKTGAAPATAGQTAPAGPDTTDAPAHPKASAGPAPAAATPPEPKHAAKTGPARQDGARRRAVAKSAGAPARLASRHADRHSSTQKKQAAPVQPAAAVDSDVALISAVMQHASNRAGTEDADCGPDGKCAAKATNQP